MNPGAPFHSIRLTGLRVFAFHGVLAEEQASGQEFVIDVTVFADLSEAGAGDDLSDTIDYGDLATAIHNRVSTERWNLLERVAERVADLVLEDERSAGVEVTIHKPAAPIPVPFEDVAVSLRRWK